MDKRRRFILKSVALEPMAEDNEIAAGGEENIYMLVLVFILVLILYSLPDFLLFRFNFGFIFSVFI